MSNDLQTIVKCLLVFGSQLVKNLYPRSNDQHGPARAEAAWRRFRRDIIAAGNKLHEFPPPIADWILRLGRTAKLLDELAGGRRVDAAIGKFDFALFDSLIGEGERLLKEHAPRPAGPFAAFADSPPTPASTTATGTRQSEGEKPKAGRSKRISRAEAEVLVREWLLKNAKDNPAAITRDAVAVGTGVSGPTVSRTSAWKAFRERRDANAQPKPREVPLTEGMLSVVKGDDGRDAELDELAALVEEQKADEAEQERRYKMRRNGRSNSF
jgi:hypothetical protein